jgi:ribosomal protein S18 acetylase RimI-like enzyme
MHIVSNWNELQNELILRQHNVCKSFTNFFPDQSQFEILIQDRKIYIHDTDHTLWILRQDNGFQHLFYSNNMQERFSYDFNQIQSYMQMPITITVIDTAIKIGKIEELILGLGFHLYSEFRRFSRTKDIFLREMSEKNDVVRAVDSDANDILALFIKVFDPYDDEIPNLNEIYSYIKRECVFVVRVVQKIAGCLITTKRGMTSYFQYIVVDEQYRGQKVASKLMQNYLENCLTDGIVRCLLWVRENNTNAVSYYNHFNFRDDGLRKKIFFSQEML